MSKTLRLLILLMLAFSLALAQTASAGEEDPLKGIFDMLTAEGSAYTKTKELYSQYFEGIGFTETLAEDSITLAINGNDYMNGSWTFEREGDYLTLTVSDTDFNGAGMATYVLNAVGEYYGMNTVLLNAYVNGLSVVGIESPWFKSENDDEALTTKFSIYIAGPYDMKELDQMEPSEEILSMYGYEPLGEHYGSSMFNLGKISMTIKGSAQGVTILLLEYGKIDALGLRSLKTVVSYMKPDGWEAFTSGYMELKDEETEDYSVQLNADEETVREIYPESFEGYSNALIRIGTEPQEGEEDFGGEFPADEYFNGTFWESGDLKLEAVWQDGYYKIAILDGETELSYLCYLDEETGCLTGIGTGVEEFDEEQPDHGIGLFYIDDDGNLVWQTPEGAETVFLPAAG